MSSEEQKIHKGDEESSKVPPSGDDGGNPEQQQKQQKQQQQQDGGKKKKEKKTPKNIVIPPKKPKLTKAERRALQEAQRAAKGQRSDGGEGGKKKKDGTNTDTNEGGKGSNKNNNDEASSSQEKKSGSTGSGSSQEQRKKQDGGIGVNDKTLTFFSHLPPYKGHHTRKHEFSGVVLGKCSSSGISSGISSSSTQGDLHPAVLSLGFEYTTGNIRGANARAKAMLYTFKEAIKDYTPASSSSSKNPAKAKDIRSTLVHDLLKPTFNYFSNTCRAHSVTMGNAFTFLKKFVMDMNRDIDLPTLKEACCDAIDRYIQERIVFADKVICENACMKIVNGDVILTYANSEVIKALLVQAHKSEQKNFRVIIVDSRPLLEGRKVLEVLRKAGIECTYIFLNSVSYVMKEVTKTFLGAAALMSDGSILSRVGAASVALMARSNNVPVLFCCETYKITSRVQLESITGNELGNPDDLISTQCAIDKTMTRGTNNGGSEVLNDWRSSQSLRLLNLLYDLTPSEFVSGIVTEMGILPPTSVAVLLREMNPQDNDTTFKAEIF